MREGWQKRKLCEVCTFEKFQGFHDNLPYVGLEDIESCTGRFLGKANTQKAQSATFRFSQSHVLYGRLRPYLNKVLAPDFEGHCSTEIFPLRPSKKLSREFLKYWLLSEQTCERINATCTGARMPRAQMNQVLEFDFLLPPLHEQQRIVALLDDAFSAIETSKANTVRNLQNARAAFERQLQLIFNSRNQGWLETTLESCCEQIFAGGDVPKDSLSKVRTPEFSIPIFSNGEKDGGLYGFTDRARVTQSSVTVSARGTLGFAAIRREPFLPVVRLIVLVPRLDQICLSFLYYTVKAIDFGNTGTSIPQLTVPNIKRCRVQLPSLQEQSVIARKLDSLSKELLSLSSVY